MSAQKVFDNQDLRQEIMSWKTKAELVDRKKIENERITKCKLIYPSWTVTPSLDEPLLRLVAKTIYKSNNFEEYRWSTIHNETLLVYPVTPEWWFSQGMPQKEYQYLGTQQEYDELVCSSIDYI